MTTQASVYLTEKCDTLDRLLTFFCDKKTAYCRTLNEKRAVFLSQIDFWDWEMASLIYSFDNFEKRSENWESALTLRQCLIDQNLLIRDKVLDDLEAKRGQRLYGSRYIIDENDDLIKLDHKDRIRTIAPVDKLNKLIKKWNNLLSICEKDIMTDEHYTKTMNESGSSFLINLDKFRKKEFAPNEVRD